MRKSTYYNVLQVKSTSLLGEIKESYQKLILKYHPDKCSELNAAEKFREVLEAWRVLSDSQLRKSYDAEVGSCGSVRFGEETLLSEFLGPEEGVYYMQCRCGGEYEITLEDLCSGYDTIQCSGCSLHRTVIENTP